VSVDPDPRMPMPHRPGIMLIHLHDRCNLLCQHCYLDAAPWGQKSLPLELVLRCIGEAPSLGVATLILSGGEPFLYPGLPEVLTYAAQQHGLSVYVSTNGTQIGHDEATRLRDTRATVNVSIDGPEAYHDTVRGREGTFRLARSGIRRLVAAGVPTGIAVTLCRDNLKWLSWLAEWACELGVKQLIAQPLLQLGRGVQIRERKLSEEQLCDLVLQMSDLGREYTTRGLRFMLACRTRQLLSDHPCAAYVCNGSECHRGVVKEIKKLVIREDGTVLPESPSMNYRFALGSVHDRTLRELTTHYFANGYAQFDRLCRSVYYDVMPTWTSPLVPWDEILAERSWEFEP
jgi:MoaA/NifB/PqqE/SkfB family radical SAM enzyme